jgi:hypothetical protein
MESSGVNKIEKHAGRAPGKSADESWKRHSRSAYL